MERIDQFNRESNALGKQLAEEAIALDPEYAMAYRALARAHQMDVWLGTSKSPKQSLAKSLELYKKAIELDPTYAAGYAALGFQYSTMGKYDKGVETAEKGVELNPNTAYAYAMLGHTLRFAGRFDEAIAAYKKAIRLDPIPPTNHLFGLGLAYCATGQYKEAIEWCEKAVRKDPDSFLTRLFLTGVYGMAGREEDARAEAVEVLRINPKFSVEKWAKRTKGTARTKEFLDRIHDAFRKAGLPE
jgi:adenylate cyclase